MYDKRYSVTRFDVFLGIWKKLTFLFAIKITFKSIKNFKFKLILNIKPCML